MHQELDITSTMVLLGLTKVYSTRVKLGLTWHILQILVVVVGLAEYGLTRQGRIGTAYPMGLCGLTLVRQALIIGFIIHPLLQVVLVLIVYLSITSRVQLFHLFM